MKDYYTGYRRKTIRQTQGREYEPLTTAVKWWVELSMREVFRRK